MMERIDLWLLGKIFIPISKWADYRFHLNPWKIAIQFMMVSALMVAIQAALFFVRDPLWMGIFNLLSVTLILFMRSIDIIRLTRISNEFERRPDIMPRDTMIYTLVPSLRILYLWFGGVLGAALVIPGLMLPSHVPTDIPMAICTFWIFTAGIGFYFAACPRPPAKRKKAEEKAPIGAQMAGVRS